MKLFNKRALSALILLSLVLSILLSSLTSCNLFAYVADSKEEIEGNIGSSIEKGESEHDFVADYLREWGLPKFDRLKYYFTENCFDKVYNYEGGLPETLTHATETAKLFIEYYYDEIDLEDQVKVTDALIRCYIAVLDDPYAVYRTAEETNSFTTDMSGSFGGIGVVVRYDHENQSVIVETVYNDSPAEEAGLKKGDLLYAVDGQTIDDIGYQNIATYIRGEIGTTVEITVIRDGDKINLTAVRKNMEEVSVSSRIEDGNIGYVQILSFKGNTLEQFVSAITSLEEAGVKGIIFDLRDNPGGYLTAVTDVLSYILESGLDLVTYRYKDSAPIVVKTKDDSKGFDHVINLPMTVICNENTASAGEIFTAALRDYAKDGLIDVTIVGATTYGKGIMQNSYKYNLDGSSITMTIAYYDPPCGINYHGIGIEPDIPVTNTDSEDLQLLTARAKLLELINAN